MTSRRYVLQFGHLSITNTANKKIHRKLAECTEIRVYELTESDAHTISPTDISNLVTQMNIEQ